MTPAAVHVYQIHTTDADGRPDSWYIAAVVDEDGAEIETVARSRDRWKAHQWGREHADDRDIPCVMLDELDENAAEPTR